MPRGGRRKGAGRRTGSIPKTTIRISLPTEAIEWLDSVTNNRSEFIEEAIAQAKDLNMVVIRTAKYETVHGAMPENNQVGEWEFLIAGQKHQFNLRYGEAEIQACAIAIQQGTRVVELLPQDWK
jgi:hypothetical protein